MQCLHNRVTKHIDMRMTLPTYQLSRKSKPVFGISLEATFASFSTADTLQSRAEFLNTLAVGGGGGGDFGFSIEVLGTCNFPKNECLFSSADFFLVISALVFFKAF